jgi:isohexenylglutaconyl-CoA hydratase
LVRSAYEGCALVVTLDDPASKNALSGPMVDALSAEVGRLVDHHQTRALVLRGANGSFCAGGSLVEPGSADRDAIRRVNLAGAKLLRQIFDAAIPVLAVVDGPAFGGGLGLACCADIVIAGPAAKFALSETSLGLVPAQIAPFVCSRVGPRIAVQLALTGERFDGARAVTLGLADYFCGGSAELEGTLAAQLRLISRCAPAANAVTKSLFRSLGSFQRGDYAEHAADIFMRALEGEGKAGIAAFRAKEKPPWWGEGS